MSKLRVLAVDDEALALRRLELLLMRDPEVDLVATARNGEQAIRRIADAAPDVVLLDIKMGGAMDGFQVLESIQPPYVPLVIFVTAFDEFAARAFDVSAVDYVVKPVEHERLAAALAKARRTIETSGAERRLAELHNLVDQLRHQPATAKELGELWAQRRGQFVRVLVEDIDWVEAERDYVHLHRGAETFMLRDTLANLQCQLGAQRFVRIRRSALVNLSKVDAVRRCGYGDIRVLLTSGDQLRVGRTYLKAIKAMLSCRSTDRG